MHFFSIHHINYEFYFYLNFFSSQIGRQMKILTIIQRKGGDARFFALRERFVGMFLLLTARRDLYPSSGRWEMSVDLCFFVFSNTLCTWRHRHVSVRVPRFSAGFWKACCSLRPPSPGWPRPIIYDTTSRHPTALATENSPRPPPWSSPLGVCDDSLLAFCRNTHTHSVLFVALNKT